MPFTTDAALTTWEAVRSQANFSNPLAYSHEIATGLKYTTFLAQQPYGLKPLTGEIRYRPTQVRDDQNRTLTFTYATQPNGAQLLSKVSGPAGLAVNFEYAFYDSTHEAFLTRVWRSLPPTTLNGIDNSQWATMVNQGKRLEFEYTYQLDAKTVMLDLEDTYERYLAYFELTQGCGIFTEVMCTSGGFTAIMEGNPCHSAMKAVNRLESAVVDNILEVKRSGIVELTNGYDTDVYSLSFDTVQGQTYGASTQPHVFEYLREGPREPNEEATNHLTLPFTIGFDDTPQSPASPDNGRASTARDS